MDRLTLAYILMALIVIGCVAGIAYARHHSPGRTYLRQREEERATHEARLAEKRQKAEERAGR